MTPHLIGRLTAPITILAVLLLVIAFGSAWYVRNMQQSVSNLLATNVASVRAAQELEISIRVVRTQFDRYLITLDESHLKPIPLLKDRTSKALDQTQFLATTPQEQVLMKRTRVGYEHFFEEYDRILREREQWKYPKIIELIDTVLQNEILEPAHEYLRLNEGMLFRVSETNQQLADRLTTGLIALGFCGSIGGLLGGTVLTAAIRRSILKTEEQMRTTAEQLDQAVHRGRTHTELMSKPRDVLEQMSLSASAVLDRLRQTERDALRAEQLAWVGQMAAGIAHEIRNPLMSIKLLVQAAAERRGRTAFKHQDLQVLEEEIIRLEQIVSGFLDFARPPRLEPRTVEVKELVERTTDGVKARAELQGVHIRIETAPGPTVASADPNQLRQVIFNLLFNALDAQPEGGHISIRIEMDESHPKDPQLLVIVEDGGPGIPEDLGERIFEPFVSTKETGLGLGLSICRRIMETHGGALTVDSSAAGTKFTMHLPVVRASAGSLNSYPLSV